MAEMVERTCVGCRENVAADEMLRLAAIPVDPFVVPDFKGKLGGRGVWVHATDACLARACESGFSKSLKRSVRVDEQSLRALVGKALHERFTSLLRGAERSRHVVLGNESVQNSMAGRRARFVWVTEDAGQREYLEEAAEASGVRFMVLGTSEDMGDFWGRDRVATIAVEDEGLGAAIERALLHLCGLHVPVFPSHKQAREATAEDRKRA